ATTFLVQNDLLRHNSLIPDGLSLRVKVGLSYALRSNSESEDLKTNAEKFVQGLGQLAFASVDKELFLRRNMDQTAVTNQRQKIDNLSRGALQYKDSIDLNSYRSLTSYDKDDSDDQKTVPIVRITRGAFPFSCVSCFLFIVNIVFLKRFGCGVVHPTVSHTFLPSGWSCLLHLETPICSETEQYSFRVRLHKLFNLPLSAPCLRPAQSITFAPTKLLRSPHLHIKNYKPRGVVSTVKGDYNYYHYMQDGFDDAGWGCAYRSLQSIWSWFILNGFTDKPVPTHLDIQKCLVEIKDKEEKFIGSKQWIGSTEIGFVLDQMLGIESRYIITNSGNEVPERARELLVHFQTVGSPVMIGNPFLIADFSLEACKAAD
ncbi:unnamed protein product, partial [Strongylus vulgaris]